MEPARRLRPGCASQMTPYLQYRALLLTSVHKGLVKSSALHREKVAIRDVAPGVALIATL
jgi:hypothetical protein